MKRCLALSLAALLLAGCSAVSREPDNLALVRVLGVDGDDRVTLTAVCGDEGQQEILRGSVTENGFERARHAVVWSGSEKELSLTGVSYLVVSPEVELEELLFAVLKDSDLGGSAAVWVAERGAAALLGRCNDPAADLELLALQGVEAPSVSRALAALTTDGEVRLPALSEELGRLTKVGDIEWSADD